MKELFCVLLLSLSLNGFSQETENSKEDSIPDAKAYLINIPPSKPVVEQSYLPNGPGSWMECIPEFAGGMRAMNKYFKEHLQYPKEANDKDIQGKVVVEFIVEKDGSLSNIHVKRGIGGGCDEETIRLVQAMPKWKPGIQNGKPVSVRYTLPVTFALY